MNRTDWAVGAGTLLAGLAIGVLFTQSNIYPPGSYQRPRPSPSPCPICPSPTPEPTPDPSPSASPSPTPTPQPTPTPTPGLPPLAFKGQWELNMKNSGNQWCEYEKKVVGEWAAGTGPVDSGMSYYDGEEVFYHIFDYTGDAYWKDCSQEVEKAYRGQPVPAGTPYPGSVYPYGYVHGNGGSVPGYWNFTLGITIDWLKTQDEGSKSAVQLLGTRGAYCATGTTSGINAGLSREVAYCVRAYINGLKMGLPTHPNHTRYVDYMFGHIDQWVNGTYRAPNPFSEVPAAAGQYYLQPFMVGLTMRSIIMEYERTQDPRAYPAVSRAAHLLQTIAYDPNSKSLWYENWAPTLPEIQPKAGAPDLNMLILPAYGWLYSIDKDPNWITFADQLFEGGVKGAWLGGTKQFNQNYTWSFDYLKWRDGTTKATSRSAKK